MTYLFYDLETSGTNEVFDQIFQFAGIITDNEFELLDEKEIRIKLRPDVVISPGAMITTNLSLEDVQEGSCEYEAIKEIHALFNTPNTISVGYNSFSFDDLFLRFAFYRNLLSPYTHQFQNGCSRFDILPITVFYYLFNRDIISWPVIDEITSLKLENLIAANNLVQGQAHDALVDVRATLELAKILRENQQMWNYCIGYFDKRTDQRRFNLALGNNNAPQLVDGIPVINLACNKFQSKNNFVTTTYFIGVDNHHNHKFLRLDDKAFDFNTIDKVHDNIWVINKKLGDNILILPDHENTWNSVLEDNLDKVNHNLNFINNNPNFIPAVQEYHLNHQFDPISNLALEAKLYQTNFNDWDNAKAALQNFHNSEISDKFAVVQTYLTEYKTFHRLANRIICRNYSENVPDELNDRFVQHLNSINNDDENSRYKDYKNKPIYNSNAALADIEEMLEKDTLTTEQIALLNSYKQYLNLNN
jgi:exodeoxyribonuclease I